MAERERASYGKQFQVFVPQPVVTPDGDIGVRRYLNGRLLVRPRQVVLSAAAVMLLFGLNWVLSVFDVIGLPDVHKVSMGLSAVLMGLIIFKPFGGVDSWTWLVRWLRARREAIQGWHHLSPPQRGRGKAVAATPAATSVQVTTGPRKRKGDAKGGRLPAKTGRRLLPLAVLHHGLRDQPDRGLHWRDPRAVPAAAGLR